MKKINSWALALALGSYWSWCGAGTLVESRDGDGNTVIMRIGDHRARIDTGDPQAYMVMDLDSGQVFMVSPPQRMVILIAGGAVGESAATGEDTATLQVQEQGPGDTVLGYATRRYRVIANGRQCFDDYLSRVLLDLPGMRRFAEVMATAGGGPGAAGDPCEQAAEAMGRRYASLGVPLRTVEPDGSISHEIIRVEKDRDFPDDIFVLPPDYQQVDQQALMDQARAAAGMPHGMEGSSVMSEGMSEEEKAAFERRLEQMQQDMQRETTKMQQQMMELQGQEQPLPQP